MLKVDIALNRTQYNLFAMVAAHVDMTDSIKKLQVLGVAESAAGDTVKQLNFKVLEQPTVEGLAWVQKLQVEIEGHNPVFLELDTQTATLKNPAMPEHANVILTIGLETENLNHLPLQ